MAKPQFGPLKARVLTGRTIYVLIHARGRYHDEEVKQLGIFSSKALAQETAKLLQNKPGFRNSNGRFRIYDTVIDRLEWAEGFIS